MANLDKPCGRSRAGSVALPLVLATAFLVAGVPLFLRMPVWCDTGLYDTAARAILTGGVHYRDVFDTNLPGFVWVTVAVRTAFGWSSEAIRLADLLVVAGLVAVLDRLAAWGGASGRARAWAVAGVCGFYPFTSEFVHAQRDVWLALPAVLAVLLRVRGGGFWSAFAQGLLWGAAVWIKPHVLAVAVPVWAFTARGRGWVPDLFGNLLGGLLLGVIGVAYLVLSGTWPHFWAVMTEWNPAYSMKAFQELPDRVNLELFWFPPWSSFQSAAVPLALLAVVESYGGSVRRILRNVIALLVTIPLAPYRLAYLFVVNPVAPLAPAGTWAFADWLARALHAPAESDRVRFVRGALAVLYLSWVAQAFVLQRAFQYAHVAELLLMFAVASAFRWCLPALILFWLLVTSAFMLATEPGMPLRDRIDRWERVTPPDEDHRYFVRHPLADPERMRWWGTCFHKGLSPRARAELADALRYMGEGYASTNWSELDEVVEFLDGNVGDRELIAWHDSTHPLYLILNVKPGLRFMHVDTALDVDPPRSVARVMAELRTNRTARFAVVDLEAMEQRQEQGTPFDGNPAVLHSRSGTGRYVVLELKRWPAAGSR